MLVTIAKVMKMIRN